MCSLILIHHPSALAVQKKGSIEKTGRIRRKARITVGLIV
jgi:hypothetical protein